MNPSPTLLDLPPALRIRILSYLLVRETDVETPSKKKNDPYNQYLHPFTFFIDRDRISKTPTARGYPGHTKQKASTRSEINDGVFLVCKAIREEALDVWFSHVTITFQEFSRQAKYLEGQPVCSSRGGPVATFGRADAIATLSHSDDESGWLSRVRRCEVRFTVETEWELRHFPSKLSLLMSNLNMQKMQRFRVVVRFVKTWFYHHRPHRAFSWRMAGVLRSRVEEQKGVGEATWRGVVREVEGLGLRRWEGMHEVFFWQTWEMAEGGLGSFEELGGVMGAVVRGSDTSGG
ncbi:hypothetical protein M409DRAFT_25763 [Zasmidium cellare ATCC 36951]|uniref:F-box domain-containing protein n=1 Tax=Zasmidium cellare ATCC 36951 TaxID=1080233 RepID=A0A6A6CEB0_ZASCE|nr:uncharacterized protein M409DRAFT_25763 [Zasmidium cellare ATCC 36951]KAF2163989.1 hypothetical protein M409DRAFT_25763 [Zasmidium cellare ATCC 36951]